MSMILIICFLYITVLCPKREDLGFVHTVPIKFCLTFLKNLFSYKQ